MRSKVLSLALLCAACLIACPLPAMAQETQPGDACTGGQTDHVRQVGGPETSGVTHLLVCDGSTWNQLTTWLADGSVGIGTANSVFELSVEVDSPGNWDGISIQNTAATGGSELTFGNDDDDAFELGVDSSGSGGDAYIWTEGARPIAFVTNSSERMRIDPTGNVGIGTNSPQSSLHVPDGKYIQAGDNNAGAPPAGDCDNNTERGRLSIDTTNNRLYVCNGATRGWDYTALTN